MELGALVIDAPEVIADGPNLAPRDTHCNRHFAKARPGGPATNCNAF